MKNYLDLWGEDWDSQESIVLPKPVSVIGERKKHFGTKHEFARVRLAAYPAQAFEVEDNVAHKSELEELNAGWPECVIFGVLDELMLAEPGPLYKVRIVLEAVWYHEIDSTREAFRYAGRDAGRQILESIRSR